MRAVSKANLINEDNDIDEKDIITQAGADKNCPLFKAVKPWQMKIHEDGPNLPIEIGSIVRLEELFGLEQFYLERVIPVRPGIPPVGKYRVRIFFQVLEGEHYVSLEPGDLVSLTREEAIPHLRKYEIEPVDQNVFTPFYSGNAKRVLINPKTGGIKNEDEKSWQKFLYQR